MIILLLFIFSKTNWMNTVWNFRTQKIQNSSHEFHINAPSEKSREGIYVEFILFFGSVSLPQKQSAVLCKETPCRNGYFYFHFCHITAIRSITSQIGWLSAKRIATLPLSASSLSVGSDRKRTGFSLFYLCKTAKNRFLFYSLTLPQDEGSHSTKRPPYITPTVSHRILYNPEYLTKLFDTL